MATYRRPAPVTSRLLHELRQSGRCGLHDFRQRFPDLTWDQVVEEVETLSRQGTVAVTYGLERGVTLQVQQ